MATIAALLGTPFTVSVTVSDSSDEKPVVDRALKTIPDALAVLADQRQNLVFYSFWNVPAALSGFVACLFYILCWPLSKWSQALETRLNRGFKRS